MEIPQQQPLMSATSPQATTARSTTEIKKLPEGDRSSLLAVGLNDAAATLLRSPSGAFDIASYITNTFLNKPLAAVGLDFGQVPSSKELSDQTGINSPLTDAANDITKYTEEFDKKFQEDYDQSITDYFSGDKPDYKKGVAKIGQSIARALPTTFAIAAASMINPAAASGVFGSGFAAQKKKELDENPALATMPEQVKVAWSILSGGTEIASEQLFGAVKVLPMLKAQYKVLGKEAFDKLAYDLYRQTYAKPVLRYFGVSAEEGLSEGFNTFLQNVYDKADIL